MNQKTPIDHVAAHATLGEAILAVVRESGLLAKKRGRRAGRKGPGRPKGSKNKPKATTPAPKRVRPSRAKKASPSKLAAALAASEAKTAALNTGTAQ